MLIGLSGKQKSGKTTAAEILKAQFGGEIISFAQPLKIEVFRALESPELLKPFLKFAPEIDARSLPRPVSGYNRSQALAYIAKVKNDIRDVVQRWGDYKRSVDPSYFIDKTLESIEEARGREVGNIYVDDCRYRDELKALYEVGFEIIRVQASDEVRQARGASGDPRHSSETELDSFFFNHVVFSNLEQHNLKSQLLAVVEQFK